MVVISVYTYGVKIIKKFWWESGFLWGVPWTPLCTNGSAGYLMLAHRRGRPCFSDVRIGNVFYSWPEMAKCFFIVFVIHILQNHTYDSMRITY